MVRVGALACRSTVHQGYQPHKQDQQLQPRQALRRQSVVLSLLRLWICRMSTETIPKSDADGRSEFPSLSGAPRPQYQNPGQAVWANANQRATQHTPVQRPQQQQPADLQISARQQQQPPQQPQEQAQQATEDIFSSGSQLSNGLGDYRHGGQGGVGQLSGSSQPQTGSIDEFPPLGRNENGDIGQDRRGNLMQNAAFGGYTNGIAFAPQSNQLQNRQGVPAGQQDNGRASTLVDRILSPSALGSAGGLWSGAYYLRRC